MKADIYLVVFNKIKKEKVAIFLSYFIYAFLCVFYILKKFFLKKQILDIEENKLRATLEKISKKPISKSYIINQPINEDIDLSIIIPVYNYEKVLEKMITSVINQKTSYNYEIIFVDDGSGDKTKDILRKYQHEKNVTVIFQQNMGISGARNTGINIAQGKYIMFIDCDDTVHNDIVEKLVGQAYKTNADIVMGAHALVKEKEGIELSRRNDIYPDVNWGRYKDNDSIMNYPGLPWGKVYKRELFEDIRFPVNYWYEDTVIQFLVFRRAKNFSYVPEVLYDYRWYEGNYSKVQTKSNTRVVERYWIVEYMLEECERLGLPKDAVLYKLILRHLGSYLYYAIAELSEEEKKAVFCQACKLVRDNKPSSDICLNFSLKELEKSFLKKDYASWILVSARL